ncbi:WD repeat-containing protein 7-like protein [Leptotrombidium deliense]|uniref:WD repeat-containing protein 7-like protein n=1 Tax=Leptotrombidium deliense TaxID=299467 RepID=A0A443STJ1_9ACAR|nr:WD repeat-containing protein 7-like protein [Leptotrombidium deliense]
MTIGLSNQLIIPITLWGKQPPTHCVSCVYLTPNCKTLITGCNDGQICLWDFSFVNNNFTLLPKYMLFGHTSAILCLTNASLNVDSTLFISSSESGEMCVWEVSDGRCLESVKLQYVHTSIQTYHLANSDEARIFCTGYYSEIIVMNPLTLEIMFTLTSRVNPDWISAAHVLKTQDDIVIGLSRTGVVKMWILTGNETRSSEPIYENEFKPVRCLNALQLICCKEHQRTILVVCAKFWQIYDAKDFAALCSVNNRPNEKWLAGDFINTERVVVWSDIGKGYIYKLPPNQETVQPYLYCTLSIPKDERLLCPPAMKSVQIPVPVGTQGSVKSKKLLLRGDSLGRIAIWAIPDVSKRDLTSMSQEFMQEPVEVEPNTIHSLKTAWSSMNPPPCGIMDRLFPDDEPDLKITASVYLPIQGRLVCGREDGSIIILSATQAVMLQLLLGRHQSNEGWPQYQTLSGHAGKVTCLLYPHHVNSRYDIAHLLSGGVDFSVCLWDLYAGTLIHRFSVHAGEVTQLLVPPKDCNPRILQSICSLGSDHSVALLNLKERKCIMLASRHLFPIQVIKWRPLEDYMIVGCLDGSVYVWQMETGLLDRVVQGMLAEEILNACDENVSQVSAGDKLTNPAIHLLRGLRSRNLAAIRHAAARGLHQIGGGQQQRERDVVDLTIQARSHPLMIQGLKTNPKDQDSHILFFDVESLIVNLLSEEYSQMSPNTLENTGLTNNTEYQKYLNMSCSPETQHKFSGLIAKVKDSAENAAQKIQAKAESVGFKTGTSELLLMRKPSTASSDENRSNVTTPSGKKPGKLQFGESNLTMELSQILLSLLHAWGLDPDLDRVCESKLGLLKPLRPVCFGLLSKGGNMSLMLNCYVQKIDVPSKNAFDNKGRHVRMKETLPDDLIQEEERARVFASHVHWELSTAITTNHLLTVISLANTLMSMNSATFIPEQERRRKLYRRLSRTDSKGEVDIDDIKAFEAEAVATQQQQVKQGWSLLAALHCVLLPDLVKHNFKKPLVEVLARRWQDRCLEIREAAQALLLAELRRIGPKSRKLLVDEWAPYLPQYAESSTVITTQQGHQQPHQQHLSSQPQSSSTSPLASPEPGQKETGGVSDDEDMEEEDVHSGDNSPHRRPSGTSEGRRKQSTAIVLLGVIGSEYGHEIEQSKRKPVDDTQRKRSVVEGFGPGNYSLARHTSHALTYLLLHPPTKSLPAHTSLRRAAVDLIGRGFTVWEPYLDVTKVLLELLELCCDADKLVPSMSFGLPLTPSADSCRTARHSLSLIATARPPAFITTLAREVARYNNLQQNAQSLNVSLHGTVLNRAKPEILRNIELLIDKMQSDVADLMIETMDIVLHCLDHNHLKNRGLSEIFPTICRFQNVSYCTATRRIAVGAKNGQLAIYELRTPKSQLITGHAAAITCCTFSPDGKHLVSYSAKENKLCFWLTATSLFGLGNSQTKCIRTYNTPPMSENVKSSSGNAAKGARLIWVSNKVVILMFGDGAESRYTI